MTVFSAQVVLPNFREFPELQGNQGTEHECTFCVVHKISGCIGAKELSADFDLKFVRRRSESWPPPVASWNYTAQDLKLIAIIYVENYT